MPAPDPAALLDQLLALSHELGRDDRRLAILAEGNTSTRVSADTFPVKASGSNLASLASLPAAIGGTPRFLSFPQVARIASRPDEHYRQRTLGL